MTAKVLHGCTLTAAAGLVSDAVNTGVVTNQTAQGTVTVICTAAKPRTTVKLDDRDNAAAGQRTMKSVTNDLLPYNIIVDPAHATVVAIGGTLFTGALTTLTPHIFSDYGQITAGTHPAGVYTYTVWVTLNYSRLKA